MTLVVERPAGDWDSRHNGVFQPSLTITTDASEFQRTPRKWLVVKTHHRTPHQLQGASSRSHYLKKGTWTEEHGHPGSGRQHCRSTLPEQTGQLSITETFPPPGEKLLLTAKRDIFLQSSPTGKNRFMDGRPIAARPFYGGVGRHPKIQIQVAVVRLRIGYVRLDKMSFSRGKVRSLIQRFRIQWKLYQTQMSIYKEM